MSEKTDVEVESLSNRNPVEKRRETFYTAVRIDETAQANGPFWMVLSNFRFRDILSAGNHSLDFRLSHTEIVNTRLRFLAFFFAIAVPCYMVVDYYTLSSEHFRPMAVMRINVSLILVFIGMLTFRRLSPNNVLFLLGLDILAITIFYVAAIDILQSGIGEIPPVEYEFMPFMIIVMLGLFPLTLISSLSLMLLVISPYLVMQFWQGNIGSPESMNMYILFIIFMGIVFMLQSGQLLLLLRLYRESTRDVLTGLINRRVLMKILDDEVAQSNENGRIFSILMLDLDRFKRVNDEHGHFTGDLVIRAIARLLELELRLGDIGARFGGEEFLVVLPGLNGDEAEKVAWRICKSCNASHVMAPDGTRVPFTISIGVAEYQNGENIDTTLKRVDDGLYRAKELGRNRVFYKPAG